MKTKLLAITCVSVSLLLFACNKSETQRNTTEQIEQPFSGTNTAQQNLQTTKITGNDVPEQPAHNDESSAQKEEQPVQQEIPPTDSSSNNTNSDKTNPADSNVPNSSELVTKATQSVYDSIQALSPKFKKCYNDAMKLPVKHGVKHFNYKDGRIDLEYDENGIIYWKDSPSIERLKKPPMPVSDFTSCYKMALPKSFDIHLQDIVKDYPDNVQRFGRLRFIYNPNSNKVEIAEALSAPIGTVHNLLEEFNQKHAPYEFEDWKSMNDDEKKKYRLYEINKHYNLWLERRSNKIE